MRKGWTLAAIALLGLVACKKKLDASSFEGNLRDQLATMGIPDAKVDCPDNVEAKQGATFQCQVQVEGKTYSWKITMTEINGDQVKLAVGDGGTMFPRKKVLDVVTAEVTKQFPNAKIDCGSDPVLFPKDDKLYCDVTSGTDKARLRVDIDGVDLKHWEIETGGGGGGSGSGSGSAP